MTETHQLNDVREMRALAHPLRLRLLGLLRTDGPATATALAEATGVTPALASYHLRQLAKHNFVEEDAARNRDERERTWRAAQARTSWETAEFLDSPERIAALSSLQRELFLRYQDRLMVWLNEVADWGRDWAAAADTSDYILELDPDGLRALTSELHEVLERYQENPPAPTGATPSESVTFIMHAFPRRRMR